MFFKDLFRRNGESTVKEVLAKDSVKQVIDDFEERHLPKAQGIIIIWATEGELFSNSGGLSEAEVVGSMNIMAHRFMHEGDPSE